MEFEHIWSDDTTICEDVSVSREERYSAEAATGRWDRDDYLGIQVHYAPFGEENARLEHRYGFAMDYLTPLVREALVARRTKQLEAQGLVLARKDDVIAKADVIAICEDLRAFAMENRSTAPQTDRTFGFWSGARSAYNVVADRVRGHGKEASLPILDDLPAS